MSSKEVEGTTLSIQHRPQMQTYHTMHGQRCRKHIRSPRGILAASNAQLLRPDTHGIQGAREPPSNRDMAAARSAPGDLKQVGLKERAGPSFADEDQAETVKRAPADLIAECATS
jgi:hypothetical protein